MALINYAIFDIKVVTITSVVNLRRYQSHGLLLETFLSAADLAM